MVSTRAARPRRRGSTIGSSTASGDLGVDVRGDDVARLNAEAPVVDVWLPLDAAER